MKYRKNSLKNSNFKYKPKLKLFAFIDVLGFKKIVENDKIKEIETYFGTIESELKDQADWLDIEILAMSDSVALMINAPKQKSIKKVFWFLNAIKNIQFELAKKGLFLRGAIVVKSIYFDRRSLTIVGKALTKAVELEREAFYPQIILDDSVIKKYGSNGESRFLEQANTWNEKQHWGKNLLFQPPKWKGCINNHLALDYLELLQWEITNKKQATKHIESKIRPFSTHLAALLGS